jgi:TetR/AcrR family transcriptional repressor of mexCD-oprJ operon
MGSEIRTIRLQWNQNSSYWDIIAHSGTIVYQQKYASTGPERRILEQAVRVLAEGRGRTMQEIADISGIGRTTLYRHFRTREDLIQAIRVHALEDARAAKDASRLEEGNAEDALRRLIAAFVSVGDYYRVLVDEGLAKEEMHGDHEDLETDLYALVERGQREGTFTTTLSPHWILTTMGHLILAAIEQVRAGELARNHAATTVADTLLRGISGSPGQPHPPEH